MNKRMVCDITRMTVHNGPGIRTVIFFKGCPLRCVWCSTPESQMESPELAFYQDKCIGCGDCIPVCPSGAITAGGKSVSIDRDRCDTCGACSAVCYAGALKMIGRSYTVDELVREILKDEVMYRHSGGGVTLSGGEPLTDPDFIVELLNTLKDKGISAGVDTCGFVPRNNLAAVLPLVDFFLWDVKHMDDAAHRQLTGASNRIILENLSFTAGQGIPIYLRIPVIPGLNDHEDNLRAVCEFAAGLPSLVEIDLLPIHHLGQSRYTALGRDYPIEGIPFIEDAIMNEKQRLVESYGLKCRIIG